MAIMIRSNTEAGSFIASPAGILILCLGIPFLFLIIFCILGFFGFFGCVMGNGITNCCRRARARRGQKRQRRQAHREERWHTRERERTLRLERENEREQEQIRRRERQEWEKAQKRAHKYQAPEIKAPEVAHTSSGSSMRFHKGRRPTHGPSAHISGSADQYNDDGTQIPPSQSRIDEWNRHVQAPSKSDNASLHSMTSSQNRTRLHKHSRVFSAGTSSQASAENLSPNSRRSEEYPLRSVGSSSRLFDDRGSVGRKSTSTMPLLTERH